MDKNKMKELREAKDPVSDAIVEIAEGVDERVGEIEEKTEEISEAVQKHAADVASRLDRMDEGLQAIDTRFQQMEENRGPIYGSGNLVLQAIPEQKRYLVHDAIMHIPSGKRGSGGMNNEEFFAGAMYWFYHALKAQCPSRFALSMQEHRSSMDKLERAFHDQYGGMTIDEVKAAYAEGADATGGYLVPTPVAAEILRIALDSAVVAPRCRQMPMRGKQLEVPNEATGVTVYWGAEADNLTRGEAAFGINLLDAKRIHGAARASIEALEDSIVGLMAYTNQVMAEKIGWELDQEILEGDGTNFTGLVSESAVNSVATTTTNGELVSYNDLVDAAYAADETSIESNAMWFMHRKIFGTVVKLKDDNGFPIFSQVPFSPAPASMILGYPAHKTSSITTTRPRGSNTSTSNIYFGDPRRIIFGTRQDLRYQVTEFGPGWPNYQVDMRLVGRFAATVGTPAAFSKIVGCTLV